MFKKTSGCSEDFKYQKNANANAVVGGKIYDDQMITQEKLMELIKWTTPEQLQQILNVLGRNTQPHSRAHMAGNPSIDLLKWIIDSGATDHRTGSRQHLHNDIPVSNAGKVQLPIGDSAPISHIGNI